MNPPVASITTKRRHSRIATVALTLGLPWLSHSAAHAPPARFGGSSGLEVVVLLHGWWSHPLAMLRIEWSLRAIGYQVVNVAYRSVRVPLAETAAHRLPKILAQKVPPQASRVHFVTHSMGGLLLREYLEHHRPANLGRIVMLAPPNQGSELADGPHLGFTRWVAGPNHLCLQTTYAAPSTAPLAGIEIGIVAGDRALLPFNKKLPMPHDGRVSVDSTRLAGMKDHRVVSVSHSVLPWNRKVMSLVQDFLATGEFDSASRNSIGEARRESGCGESSPEVKLL